jgi:hypothetical protein
VSSVAVIFFPGENFAAVTFITLFSVIVVSRMEHENEMAKNVMRNTGVILIPFRKKAALTI